MTYTLSKPLSVDDFIGRYAGDPRYELADGELIGIEPTGSHEAVGGKLAARIGMAIAQAQQPCFIPRTCLIRPSAEVMTVRRPDVVVLDETVLANEPRWEREPGLRWRAPSGW